MGFTAEQRRARQRELKAAKHKRILAAIVRNCAREKCGKQFSPKHRKNQIYCSRECKGLDHNLRNYYTKSAAWKAIRKRYLIKNAAKIKVARLLYEARTKEQRKQRMHEHYLKHKARWRNYRLARRAREKTSPEEMVRCEAFISAARSRRVNTCYYCGERIKGIPHIDHITPLGRGGKHEVGNLCVAHKFCNMSKGAHPISNLRLAQPLLLPA